MGFYKQKQLTEEMWHNLLGAEFRTFPPAKIGYDFDRDDHEYHSNADREAVEKS